MTTLRDQINENYVKANRFVQERQCFIYPLAVLYILLLILAILADYALNFSFFSKLAENVLGVLPPDKLFSVALKSVLPVAVAVVLKFSFTKLPRLIQTIGFWVLFALGLTIAIGAGRTQMTPVLIEAVEQIFPSETELPEELVALFGDDESINGNTEQRGISSSENEGSESESLLSKNRFIEDFEAYALAYLMMTAFAVTAWMMLSNLYQSIKKIRQLKNTIIRPYKILLQKEHELPGLIDKKDYLESNREKIYRAGQDMFVKAYSGGLAVIKLYLNDLKIYGDHKRASSKFPFNQIYKVRWLRFVNVDVSTEMIEKADESINKLVLVDQNKIHTQVTEHSDKVVQIVTKHSKDQMEGMS